VPRKRSTVLRQKSANQEIGVPRIQIQGQRRRRPPKKKKQAADTNSKATATEPAGRRRYERQRRRRPPKRKKRAAAPNSKRTSTEPAGRRRYERQLTGPLQHQLQVHEVRGGDSNLEGCGDTSRDIRMCFATGAAERAGSGSWDWLLLGFGLGAVFGRI